MAVLWIVLTPLLALPGILWLRRSPNLREAISLIAAAGLLIQVVWLYQQTSFNVEHVTYDWVRLFGGLDIAFKVEPLSLLYALVASFLWLITTIYSIGYLRAHHEPHQTRFFCFFAISMACVMGLAFSANLFTLFVFYEALTLATFPLVTHTGTGEAKKAGRVYLGILFSASILLFLLAIFMTYMTTGSIDFVSGGLLTQVSPALSGLLLVLFVFGIGKAALMPLHGWLPAAMVAPTPVSALLHAVAVVKAGVFSILKISIYIFGFDALNEASTLDLLIYTAGGTILIASLIAMRQDNLKARLAYSTVGQLAYVTLGAMLANKLSITGGSLHIAMHAFGKITLFFCAGAIMVTAHKKKVSELSGLGYQMPLTMTAFFIGCLSIIGLPPTGGLWSKWYLGLGSLEAGYWSMLAVLMISSLLNIYYLLVIPAKAFFPAAPDTMGHVSARPWVIKEAPLPCLVAMVITAAICIGLFFNPDLFYQLALEFVSHG